MKKIIFAAFSIFAGTDFIYAQVNLINSSLIIPDSNTAFIGVQNVFEIVNADKATYTLKANSTSIQPAEKLNSFIVKPHSAGADTFQIIKNGKTVYSKVFTRIFLPPPQAILGSIVKDVASKEEIIANKGLVVNAFNFKGVIGMPIRYYTLKIKSNAIKDEDKVIVIAGSLLSPKAITVINTLTPGDLVTFDEIQARTPDTRIVTLKSFSITIK
jgi:hypothetical protein